MGYEGVEFFGPYFAWTEAFAKDVRRQLDDLHLPCFSTHNEAAAFTDDGLSHAIELNQILGSQNIVCVRGLASAGKARPASAAPPNGFPGEGLDGWKQIGDRLSKASDRLRALKMTCAFHNHSVEFKPIEGTRPIDILARNKELVFHLDSPPAANPAQTRWPSSSSIRDASSLFSARTHPLTQAVINRWWARGPRHGKIFSARLKAPEASVSI